MFVLPLFMLILLRHEYTYISTYHTLIICIIRLSARLLIFIDIFSMLHASRGIPANRSLRAKRHMSCNSCLEYQFPSLPESSMKTVPSMVRKCHNVHGQVDWHRCWYQISNRQFSIVFWYMLNNNIIYFTNIQLVVQILFPYSSRIIIGQTLYFTHLS